MKEIAAAFVKAKRAFAPALKTSTNPHFKNKYVDLQSCVDAVDGPLLDNGIVMYQETFEDSTGVTVETVLLHETGESLRCGKLHVPASKQDPQGYGSALTYARRYSLMAACGIAPEDDDGNAASRTPEHPKPIKHSPVPKEELGPEEQFRVASVVRDIGAEWDDGNQTGVLDIWYHSGQLKSNDEITAAWKALSSAPKIRAFIKANQPERKAA